MSTDNSLRSSLKAFLHGKVKLPERTEKLTSITSIQISIPSLENVPVRDSNVYEFRNDFFLDVIFAENDPRDLAAARITLCRAGRNGEFPRLMTFATSVSGKGVNAVIQEKFQFCGDKQVLLLDGIDNASEVITMMSEFTCLVRHHFSCA